MEIGCTAANKNYCLKYQAIHIGPAWEDNKIAIYTEINSCFPDGEGWSYIKEFDMQKYFQQDTANLRENYEVAEEVNKRIAWLTEKLPTLILRMNTHTHLIYSLLCYKMILISLITMVRVIQRIEW